MKLTGTTISCKDLSAKLLIMFFISLFPSGVSAVPPVDPVAKAKAVAFFTVMDSPKKAVQEEISVSQLYRSPSSSFNSLYVFQKDEEGFVLILKNTEEYIVAGYSAEGRFSPDNIPETFRIMMEGFEQSESFPSPGPVNLKNASVIVAPLLDRENVSLNQYYHAEAGNCPTGCVATAMAQIMAYYKFPDTGNGSHCYEHPIYGTLCADFGDTSYDWGNMTDEDYKLFSFQVAVALEMNFCGGKAGSTPGNVDYTGVMGNFFNYHVHPVINDTYFILNELDNERPVYTALPGDPGHAVVLDGYDSEGYIHVNFGWGGSYNGYYLLNINGLIQIGPLYFGHTFGRNIRGTLYFAPEPVWTDEQDSLALVAIHNSMNGTTGWDLTKPVVYWQGVTVMNNRVVELRLSSYNPVLTGIIPPETGQLTELRYLNISGREINGAIPASVFNLTNLKEIYINPGMGNMSVTLPEEIGNLTNLEFLSFPNCIRGSIPSTIGNLSKLKYLYLENGELSGEIPSQTGLLTNLIYLDLQGNTLSGSIPESIGNLTSLHWLNLSENNLTGNLPASVGDLTNLEYLYVNNNQLSGNLPPEIGNLAKISDIKLFNNEFTGAIPPETGNWQNITSLNLRSNKFTYLPDEIGRLKKLTGINVGNNLLQSLPDSITELPRVSVFYADSNQIARLPENFGAWPELTEINLSYNQLEEFPEELCYLTKLSVAKLSHNRIPAFPASFNYMPDIQIFELNNNELKGDIFPQLLSGISNVISLSDNRFIFSNIPVSDEFTTGIGKQKNVPVSTPVIKTRENDTIRVDIREITSLSHPDNKYYWLKYPANLNAEYPGNLQNPDESPVLTYVLNGNTKNDVYYCKVFNDNVPQYKWEWMGNTYTTPVLRSLNTDTITFSVYSEDEMLEEKYPESFIVSSEDISSGEVSNEYVTLVPPFNTRGTITWQGSEDQQEWHDISINMEKENIKVNLVEIKDDDLILSPVTSAFYRCVLTEGTCDPLISDIIRVNPLGEVLYDGLVNVSSESITIRVDSIEITLPEQLSDEDFRLTVIKLDNPPEAPAGSKMGSVYDVTVSLGSVFNVPLYIKLKNITLEDFDLKEVPSIKAAFYDEKNRIWVPFTEGGITFTDSTVEFYTTHLTKLSWYELQHGSYTHRFTKDKADVIYKWGTNTGEENNYLGYQFGIKGFPKHPWHNSNTDPDAGGTPALVQDIAEYMNQIITRFETLGLQPEGSRFTVYVSNTGSGSLGHITVGGYNKGYFTINSALASEPDDVKSTLAHEYMHYTQSRYMNVLVSNYFWTEANAPLSDLLVWSKEEISKPEPEMHLKQAFRAVEGNKSIYDILGEAWDAATFLPVAEKFTTNPSDANVSSAFLHFMRSYREGTKLDPVKLLKDHANLGNITTLSWRTYLNNQVQEQLNSSVGDEYDDYVLYLLEGSNKNFTILNSGKANPFSNIIRNAGTANDGSFAKREVYSFQKDDNQPQTKIHSLHVPYLASKVLLLSNNTPDRSVVVNYTRKHEPEAEHKIYHCRYDFREEKVIFHDISDSAEYSLILDARTEKAAREYQNFAFLLFINKKCPGTISLDHTFNASFELEALPVININDIAYANVTDRAIHNYDTGDKRAFIISGRMDIDLPGFFHDFLMTDYQINKSMVNDSTYVVNVSFTEELTIENGPDMPATINAREKTQTISYNYISGTLCLTQHIINRNSWGAYYSSITDTYYEQYTHNVIEETQTLELKNVYSFMPKSDASFVGEVIEFKTGSTAETVTVLEKIRHSMTTTSYNSSGQVTSSETSNYVNSDLSEDNITITVWLHSK